MALEIPFPLFAGEQIIKTGKAIYLPPTHTNLGYHVLDGHCWLTNQHLIFRHTSAEKMRWFSRRIPVHHRVFFPLSHIIAVSSRPLRTGVLQITKPITVRLEFDNGGREYFQFADDPEGWRQAIIEAGAAASEKPYGVLPAMTSPIERNEVKGCVVAASIIAGLVTLVIGIGSCGLLVAAMIQGM